MMSNQQIGKGCSKKIVRRDDKLSMSQDMLISEMTSRRNYLNTIRVRPLCMGKAREDLKLRFTVCG